MHATMEDIRKAVMDHEHLYLFTLEVTPLSVGETYNPLPSHLTLMSRFRAELAPEELAKIVTPLFERTNPIELCFGKLATLGPNQVAAHLIKNTEAIKTLHSELRVLLNKAKVTYAIPQYIGDGHKPHISKREGDQFLPGHKQMAKAAYLIEVKINGKDHLRFVRSRFDLKGTFNPSQP